MEYSIIKARQKTSYRLAESSLFLGSFIIILSVIILSIWQPIFTSLLLISYAFLWIFKLTINLIYAIYSFKEYQKWSKINVADWVNQFNQKEQFLKKLTDFQKQFENYQNRCF